MSTGLFIHPLSRVHEVTRLELVGCGTILYPERHGQERGRLDATVIILDGVGLVFFLVPA